MATTFSRKTESPTYAISYGFLGGPINSRRLRKLLAKAGYTKTSLQAADIIIAHSGGTYLLSAQWRPKLLVLAAPALPTANPRKLFQENTRQLWKSAHEEQYLARRALWSLYGLGCAIRHPRRHYHMVRFAAKTTSRLPTPRALTTLYMVNKVDAWPKGPQLDELLTNKPWVFMSLPGAHEHIWIHPEDYIAIINLYAKRLLAEAGH